MYLLVFDRELAEKAVTEMYPSEGPHFLEKIIQASFELPLPARDDLNTAALSQIETLCGPLIDRDQLLRFMNMFYDAVSPYLNTPRDLTRLSNAYRAVVRNREPSDVRIDKEPWTLRDVNRYHPLGKEPKLWIELIDDIRTRASAKRKVYSGGPVPKEVYEAFKRKETEFVEKTLDEEEAQARKKRRK